MAAAFKIKAKKPGFRRAGFKFDDQSELVIPASELTKGQIEELKSEPNLLVSEVDVKAADAQPQKTPEELKAEAEAKAKAKAEAEAKAKAAAAAKKTN